MSILPAWIGIPGSILLIAAILYGFRQGMKVTRDPEGAPPETFGSGDGSGPHF
jgi:hypothetical protein